MSHTIGIIGGSGLYELEGLENLREQVIDTPFGAPSDALIRGQLDGVELVFLPRHGRGHRFTPSEVPYRANIYALKSVGVDYLISVSAVGSLRGDISPGEVVCIDQFIDRTKGIRPSSFFGEGVVAHVAFGDPIDETLRQILLTSARQVGARVHDGGTYVCMEGPAFSTRAESELYRSWGGWVVGMTNLPEAKLAREAEMAYATLAMATDFDCWHMGHDNVTVDAVIAVLMANVDLAKQIVRAAVPQIAKAGTTSSHSALTNAIMTHPTAIPQAARERLDLLIRKALG